MERSVTNKSSQAIYVATGAVAYPAFEAEDPANCHAFVGLITNRRVVTKPRSFECPTGGGSCRS